ncbi:MAG: septation protein SepH, partial [Micrococcales bacterium]
MQDLRVHSVDGDYLVLQGSDGATFRVLIDEDLRRAARRESITETDSAIISPRDIQLEIRAGFSIDELAAKTGASIEYIQKFAAPVIDELAHVVSSALSVRITIAGDRYNDTAQVEFGELISNRLAAMGVAQFSWSSKRTDNGGWQLNCRFDDSVAAWAFDPRKLSLSPENELAIQLSTQQTITDGPISKLRPVLEAAPKTQPVRVVEVESSDEVPTSPNPLPLPKPAVQISSNPATDRPLATNTAASEPKNVTADLGTTADFDG